MTEILAFIVLVVGLLLGIALIATVVFRFVRTDHLDVYRIAVILLGMVLVYGSVWETVKLKAGDVVEFEAKRKVEDESAKRLQTILDQGKAIENQNLEIKQLKDALAKVNVQPPTPPSIPSPPAKSPDDILAENNIRWVIQLDGGARRTYDRARQAGLSRFDAVVAAQAHNSGAATSIRSYGKERAEAFITQLGG